MDAPRPDDPHAVAARLVAWHNRHPLARRLSVEQVQSVGYVAVPFIPPEGTPAGSALSAHAAPAPVSTAAPAADGGLSLRERAQARAQQGQGRSMGALSSMPASPPTPTQPPPLPAAGRAKRPRAAFSEDFIAPLSPRQVARWLARHGLPDVRVPPGVPLRVIAPDPVLVPDPSAVKTLYALTGMVDIGGRRIRPLLSAGVPDAVLGTRLWSLPRVGSAAGVAASLVLVAVLAWQGLPEPASASVAAPSEALAPASETPASAAWSSSASPAMPEPVAPAVAQGAPNELLQTEPGAPSPPAVLAMEALQAHEPQGLVAQAAWSDPAPDVAREAAADTVPAVDSAAAMPPDAQPRLGRVVLPDLGLPRAQIVPRREAARPQVLADRAPAAAPELATEAAPAPLPATQGGASLHIAAERPAARQPGTAPAEVVQDQPAAAPTAGPPEDPIYALSTRLLRTRSESELTAAAVKALLTVSGHEDVHVEILPVGEDWRVVGWPFIQRAEAEKARSLLVARGLRLEVVDF